MKIKKITALLMMCIAVTAGSRINITANAASGVIIAYEKSTSGPGEGWKQDESGAWYYQKDGSFLKNCWYEDGGRKYRFGEDGAMLKGRQTVDGAEYYFTENADAAHPLGSMYVSEALPDGSTAGEDGKLIPKPEPETNAAVQTEARTNPYGNVKCVEIDLTNQMVYAYDGIQCVLESQCVTGRVINGNATPPGNFKIYSKERNRTLKGTNQDGSKYASPVSFWMPFNGGIGLHDATWRTNFNNDVYYKYGSHGCINMPYDKAAALFDIVYVGMPVYVHN